MHKTICDVGNGIKQNGTEQQDDAAKFVTENSKGNSTREHSEHLQIQQKNPVTDEQVAGKSQIFQARNPQNAEQNQIINVHEITERADDDGGLEDLAQGGIVVCCCQGIAFSRSIVNRNSQTVNEYESSLPQMRRAVDVAGESWSRRNVYEMPRGFARVSQLRALRSARGATMSRTPRRSGFGKRCWKFLRVF